MAVVPLSLEGPLGSRGHECALGKEGAQAIEGEVLHAEHPSQGTEVDVPQVEAIMTVKSLSQDGAGVF